MSNKYLLAKIEIPLELDEEGELKLMEKYMKMNIEESSKELEENQCDVPGLQTILDLMKDVKRKNEEIKKEENTEIILTVEPSEIKKRIKGGYQHTFKNRKSLHNKTCNHQKIKISLVEQDADET